MNWEPLSKSPTQVLTVAFVGSLLYCGTYGSGAYVSSDFGDTWQSINNGLPANAHVANFVVTALGTLTASVRVPPSGSDDYSLSGNVWTKIPNTGTSYFSDRTPDSDGSFLHAGQYEVSRSTDNAHSFTKVSTVPRVPPTDTNAVYCIQLGGTIIFVGTERDGVSYSTDHAQTWRWMDARTNPPEYPYVGSPSSPPEYAQLGNISSIGFNAKGQAIITTGQGAVFIQSGLIDQNTWKRTTGYPQQMATGETDPPTSDNSAHSLMLLADKSLLLHGGRMYRSTDDGNTWVEDSAGIAPGRINTPFTGGMYSLLHHTMAVGPDGKVYVGTPTQGIYRTTTAVGAGTGPGPTPPTGGNVSYRLSGKVMDSTGTNPFGGSEVDLLDQNHVLVSKTFAADDGSYLFPSIPAGQTCFVATNQAFDGGPRIYNSQPKEYQILTADHDVATLDFKSGNPNHFPAGGTTVISAAGTPPPNPGTGTPVTQHITLTLDLELSVVNNVATLVKVTQK